jgi:prepilin-type processing-associated H-X9-DG protein
MSTGTGWWVIPGGYSPKINRIGKSSEKIFAADGTKYAYQGGIPEYDVSTETLSSASTGNHSKYTDWGAWTQVLTGAYDQWTVLTSSTAFDGRVASYRHGKQGRSNPPGSYRMNAVFFDGHAESLDDRTATNPKLWLPSGSRFTDLSKFPASVQTQWGITTASTANPYIVP